MIVAGFGFRAAATVQSLADALDQAAGARTVAALATSDDKACAAAFLRLARKVGAPIRAMDAAVLERQVTVTHSAASHTA
ncbi:MAG: cobalamin biosynthesis protein, partial [Pseudomonadota bacterium]